MREQRESIGEQRGSSKAQRGSPGEHKASRSTKRALMEEQGSDLLISGRLYIALEFRVTGGFTDLERKKFELPIPIRKCSKFAFRREAKEE